MIDVLANVGFVVRDGIRMSEAEVLTVNNIKPHRRLALIAKLHPPVPRGQLCMKNDARPVLNPLRVADPRHGIRSDLPCGNISRQAGEGNNLPGRLSQPDGQSHQAVLNGEGNHLIDQDRLMPDGVKMAVGAELQSHPGCIGDFK